MHLKTAITHLPRPHPTVRPIPTYRTRIAVLWYDSLELIISPHSVLSAHSTIIICYYRSGVGNTELLGLLNPGRPQRHGAPLRTLAGSQLFPISGATYVLPTSVQYEC